MLNAKASFDKSTINVKFEKLKWRFPLEALTKVTLKEQAGKYNMTIFSDL
jgi:hypothetical protein